MEIDCRPVVQQLVREPPPNVVRLPLVRLRIRSKLAMNPQPQKNSQIQPRNL